MNDRGKVFTQEQEPWEQTVPFRWRHNGCDSVSNHKPRECLLRRLIRRTSKKHQSSASLAFVRGIHRRSMNSPHKWPVTRKMFPFDDVIMSAFSYNVHGNHFEKEIGFCYEYISMGQWMAQECGVSYTRNTANSPLVLENEFVIIAAFLYHSKSR